MKTRNYISLTHESKPVMEDYKVNDVLPELKKATIQHRVILFFKNENSLEYRCGNFGGGPSNTIFSSTRSKTYVYTPTYIFKIRYLPLSI